MTAPLLSIVIPAFHEEAGLAVALDRIRTHAEPLGRVEYIVVDDGSTDRTWDVIEALSRRDADIRGFRLSRNFGKEAAIAAGLNAARGAAVVTIDADLQHPPELLPEMVASWKAGAKVVNAIKRTRESEGPLKGWLTRRYFGLFQRLSGIDVGNSSDFKLLDREVVECLKALPERERFYRGLVGWVGFEQETLLFDVAPRVAGHGKWSPVKLLRLALDSIVSFSTVPMHLMTCLGVGFAALAAALAARTFWLWLAGNAVPGFTTVILLLIIVGALLMIGLGIIGAYIAKIYEEVKRRPGFIVYQQTPSVEPHQGRDRDQMVRPILAAQTDPAPIREVAR
jgi:dolichol-phosphate mannosyltransferase